MSASPKSKAKAKSKSKASDPAVYTKPRVRDRLKAEILAGDKGGHPGTWSARKSQLLAAAYKKAGGGYKEAKKAESQADLVAWTDEKWTTSDGAPADRAGGMARYLPEAAWDALTPAQKQDTNAKKKAGSAEGEQFVANTKAAKGARKSAAIKPAGPKHAKKDA